MTDQLDGRDLDRACAEAMGWTTKEFSSATAMVRGKELVWQPPRYSTDPSTQKEKLAWLHSEGAVCVIIGHYAGHASACATSPVMDNQHTRGATIDQALARLVCVVAKAKKEQGK